MTAEVIDLKRFRAKVAADQGFRTWLARFKEQFGPETRLQDLSLSNPPLSGQPRGRESLRLFRFGHGDHGPGRVGALPPG